MVVRRDEARGAQPPSEDPEASGSTPDGRSRRWLAPTIRLRLTLLYGALFLVTGAVLLTIGYLFVRNGLRDHHQLSAVLRRIGQKPESSDSLLSRAIGAAPGSREFKVARVVQRQLLNDALHRLALEYAIALVAMTMASVAAAYWLAGRVLSPLRAITATARRVSGENLGERIALEGPADELRELADTFDGMLARLDGAFASQRRFVANASHELRTPLAIMRTEVDVTLADPDASNDELRSMGEGVRDTIDRCEQLIAGLLMLARSEAATGHGERVDVGSLAADCITDLRAHALEAQVDVRGELEPAWTIGEPALIERLVANLVDNGIRHNHPGGFLEVSTSVRAGRVHLHVRNSGSRITSADAQLLVEPFRRLDRSVDGFGLGLSIVRSVAEAHGGTVAVAAPTEGGLDVLVQLPAAAAAPLPQPPRAHRTLTKS